MNSTTAYAYKLDDTAPLPPATKLRRIAYAEVAANDDTYHIGHFNQALATDGKSTSYTYASFAPPYIKNRVKTKTDRVVCVLLTLWRKR